MAIKIGASVMKAGYLGTSKIKHIWLDKKLAFSATVILKIELDGGVSQVVVTCTRVDGQVTTYTVKQTQELALPYGSKLAISPTPKTGYVMLGYTSGVTITTDKTLTYSTNPLKYKTFVSLKYGGTEYGHQVGNKLGTFQYSLNGSTWYGPYSNEPNTTEWTQGLTFGSNLYLRNITAGAGFRLSSVVYNGTTYYATNGIYTIPIAAGSYEVVLNYTSSTSASSISFYYAESITTNTLSRYNWNVTCNINMRMKECSAGTVIGRIPSQYYPATKQTFTTDWLVQTGTLTTTTRATITINTDGSIVSDTASTGAGSSSGGGKWGSYNISWYTQIVASVSWSVK